MWHPEYQGVGDAFSLGKDKIAHPQRALGRAVLMWHPEYQGVGDAFSFGKDMIAHPLRALGRAQRGNYLQLCLLWEP
jgi:hypothetical protein